MSKSEYNKYNFSREEIVDAALASKSRTEMMRILKIRQGGGGYQALDKWCRKYQVSPPDGSFIGHKNITKYSFVAMPNDDWFVNGTFRNGQNSKVRLLRMGVEDKCVECDGGPVWNGKPITLQIDHVNGDRWDNRIENLRIMCPNCHSQTETYANTGKRSARSYCECGKEISRASVSCHSCESESRVGATTVEYPEIEELLAMIRSSSYVQVGRLLGCSDNAVRKHIKRNGYNPKTLHPHNIPN